MGEKDETKNQAEKGSDGGGKAAVGGGAQPEKGPVTVVLKLELHCEGCAKKVKRSISNLPGVENVKADCNAKKLTVIGNDSIDPSFIREKVEQKTKKNVELISPQPKKIIDDESQNIKGADNDDKDKDKEPKGPVVNTVAMKIRLHCAECANKIKRIILKKIDGINSVTINLEKDLVTVIGKVDAKELATYLREKLKRGVDIVPPPKKDEDKKEKGKDEQKESGSKPKENGEEKSYEEVEGEDESKPKENRDEAIKTSEEMKAEMINNKMEHLSFNSQTHYAMPMHYNQYDGSNPQDYGINPMHRDNRGYYPSTEYIVRYEQGPPPPSPMYLRDMNDHMFSDENPNGCIVM